MAVSGGGGTRRTTIGASDPQRAREEARSGGTRPDGEKGGPRGRQTGHSQGWWIEQGLRPALIAAMMACLAALVALLFQVMAPVRTGAYFPVFVLLSCLEGILSERSLRDRRATGKEYALARGAELVVLLLLFKLTITLLPGAGPLRAAIERWLADPGEILGPTDFALGPALVALWMSSLSIGRLARELDEEAGRGPAPTDKTSAAYYLWLTQPPPQHDREGTLARLGSTFVWGGIAALLLAAAAQAMTGAAVALPTLLYFVLGLALLTQARFAVARGVWQSQEVPVQPSVGRRWLAWATAFLLGIGLLALLLPTGLLEVPVRVVQGALLSAFYWLSYLVMLLLYLLSIPLSFLIPKTEPVPRPEVPAVGEPWGPVEAGSPAPWLRMAGAALFWLGLAGLVVLALVRFWRDRWSPYRGGRAGRGWAGWWQRLLAWLRGLWGRSEGLRQGVWARRKGRRQAGEPQAEAPPRWLSLRRLAPVERVRFFYLSTARRAAEAGSPRAPGQTPYEYRSSLEVRFPGVEPELGGLTEAFVEARYSRRSVRAEDAERVRPLWQRIQAVLRRARRARPAGRPSAGLEEEDRAGTGGAGGDEGTPAPVQGGSG